MKEWNNPELFSLGVENTFGNGNGNGNNGNGNTSAVYHYCHKGGSSSICTGASNDHASINSNANKGHKFTGQVCTDPEHNGLNGASSCCCVGLS